MADQTVSRLVIDVVTEAESASAGFDSIASDSKRMADQVEDSGTRASRGLNVTADSTDNLASKSSQATGALGALSAGFELAGMEKYAGGLQAAAMATDFMSGVGDSLNLVLESTAVKTAIARVNTIRHAVTSRVVAAATRTWAAAQWLMNAALSANPIGLVVVAVAALVAGVVLAYKHSARFRAIVQAVGRAGAVAFGWVVDKVSDLVDFVRTTAPAAFSRMRSVANAALQAMLTPPRTLIGVLKDVVTWAKTKLPDAFSSAKDRAVSIGAAMVKPFKDVLGAVKDIIEWIKKIRVPHIPGLGRVAGPVVSSIGSDALVAVPGNAGAVRVAPTTQVTFQTVVNGAVDPMGTAATIAAVQQRAARRLGLVLI